MTGVKRAEVAVSHSSEIPRQETFPRERCYHLSRVVEGENLRPLGLTIGMSGQDDHPAV